MKEQNQRQQLKKWEAVSSGPNGLINFPLSRDVMESSFLISREVGVCVRVCVCVSVRRDKPIQILPLDFHSCSLKKAFSHKWCIDWLAVVCHVLKFPFSRMEQSEQRGTRKRNAIWHPGGFLLKRVEKGSTTRENGRFHVRLVQCIYIGLLKGTYYIHFQALVFDFGLLLSSYTWLRRKLYRSLGHCACFSASHENGLCN